MNQPPAQGSTTWKKRGVRTLRITALSAGALVTLVGVVLATIMVIVQFSFGREWARSALESGVDAAIAGRLEIDRLDSVFPSPVRAHGVRFYDPSGRAVIVARDAEIDFGYADLLAGRVQIDRARVDGGVLRLYDVADGSVSVEPTFGSPGAQPPSKRLDVEVRSIHFEGIRLEVYPHSGPEIVADRLAGFISVLRPSGELVRVRLDRVSGRWVSPAPPNLSLRIEECRGWIHAGEPQVMELEVHVELGDDPLTAHVSYFPDRPRPVQLSVDFHDRDLSTILTGLGLRAMNALQTTVSTDVDQDTGG